LDPVTCRDPSEVRQQRDVVPGGATGGDGRELAWVNGWLGWSRTPLRPYQLVAGSRARPLPSSTPSACLVTVPSGATMFSVALNSVSLVVEEA